MTTLTHDQALAKYTAIMKKEGMPPNHKLDKSALFQRLLSGKPALEVPPPLAYSYPWYKVIESNTPIFIDEPRPWVLDYIEEPHDVVLIHQSPWNVLAREDDRLRLSVPQWHALGYEWEAWTEWRTAEEAGATLLCHHDPEKPLLITSEDVQLEVEHHVQRWTNTLNVVASNADEDALRLLEETFPDSISNPPWFKSAWAQQSLERAKEELELRVKNNLPPMPDADEVNEKVIQQRRMLLGDDWEVRDGLLYRRCWLMQRILPATLPESVYLTDDVATPAV